MVNYFLFRSKRVDRRMEIYPLPHQRTISSESGRSREFVDVDTTRRAQAASACRTVYCNHPVGLLYVVTCEGNTPFGSRLPVYSRGEEKVYRVDSLFPVSSISLEDEEHRPIVNFIRAYCERVGDVEELGSLGMPSVFFSAQASPQQPADDIVTTSMAGRSGVYGVNRNLLAGISKMRSIASFFAGHGHNVQAVNQKMLLLSQLNDMMRNGVVQFQFRKQNGDIRTAYGTLRQPVISYLNGNRDTASRSEGDTQEDGEHFFYYDIQQKGWRCFCTEDFRVFERAESFYVGDDLDEGVRMRVDSISATPVAVS